MYKLEDVLRTGNVPKSKQMLKRLSKQFDDLSAPLMDVTWNLANQGSNKPENDVVLLDLLSSFTPASVPWYGLDFFGQHMIESLMREKRFALVEEALLKCKSHPFAFWNPLTHNQMNLAVVAMAYHAPFETLRATLDAMKAIGCSIDRPHADTGTPLMFAVMEDDLLLCDRTVMRDQVAICEMFLAYGANPLRRTRVKLSQDTKLHETTALHFAVQKKKRKLANAMIDSLGKLKPQTKSNLPLDATDGHGHTVLLMTINCNWHSEALKMVNLGASLLALHRTLDICPLSCFLCKKKAPGSSSLRQGILAKLGPQDLARGLGLKLVDEHKNVLEEFMKTHSKHILQSLHGNKELQNLTLQEAINTNCYIAIQMLLDSCEGIDSSKCCINPMISCKPPNTSLILALIGRGADVNTKNPSAPDGREFMIQSAVGCGDLELSSMLLEMGADIDVLDKEGNCLLHIACRILKPDARRQLVDFIARKAPWQIDVKNDDGADPVYQARGKKGMARMLRKIKEDKEKEANKEKEGEKEPEEVQPEQPTNECEKSEDCSTKQEEMATGDSKVAPSPSRNVPEEDQLERVAAPQASVVESVEKEPSILEHWVPLDETKEEKHNRIKEGLPCVNSFIVAAENHVPDQELFDDENGGNTSTQAFRDVVADHTPACSECDDSFEADATSQSDEEDECWEEPEESVLENLQNLRKLWEDVDWGMQITKEAWSSWVKMEKDARERCYPILRRIGMGQWKHGKNVKPITFGKQKYLQGLKLWKHKIGRGGRIVFEVCVDYNEDKGAWIDTIRIWVITMIHRVYIKALEGIKKSYHNSEGVLQKPKLRVVRSNVSKANGRAPRIYQQMDDEDIILESKKSEEVVEVVPPTNAEGDTHNLLKFYTIGPSLVQCIFDGLDDQEVDFPFKVSPAEQDIITKCENEPSPIILVGRSGTGKTTCAVYRMWSNWVNSHKRKQKDEFFQVFVTASATLKDQVEKTFRKLQMAVLSPEERTNIHNITKLIQNKYPLLRRHYPQAAFPLFLTAHQYLEMIDGTLDNPFFPRRDDGTIMEEVTKEMKCDVDGMDLLVMLDPHQASGEVDGSGNCEAGGDNFEFGFMGDLQRSSSLSSKKRVHMTYQMFEDIIWRKISTKPECRDLEPSLLLLEILSYIKGSAEALQSSKGFLTEEEYLKIGKKRAPAYSSKRENVYKAFLHYQKELRMHWMFDTADLVGHIYRETAVSEYKGMPIHHLVRDEVQDFSQAELLLDMRVVASPNGLFYCGDTCQTISRGVGFRFEDIRTLFFAERENRKATGGTFSVRNPLLERLSVNYRTHSGILNVACSIVDLLERYFPQYMDKLPRETAFFKGSLPHLLENNQEKDILNLVTASGSVGTSQVEFGAHQAVLVRGMNSYPRTQGVLWHGALVLTVPQAKGLEFDDVFIVNFFQDSLASREWRVLMSYLEELEKEQITNGGSSIKGGLQDVEISQAIKGFIRNEPFEPSRCILLCEELKHLYTAITRAKRNLVFFDSSIEKRSPFFHYLQRRGLAKIVADATTEGAPWVILSRPASKPSDWRSRGHHFMKNRLFELALGCFEKAKEFVWALVADAGRLIQNTQKEKQVKEQQALYFEAAYKLLIAASRVTHVQEKVEGKVVKGWLYLSAAGFSRAEQFAYAADIYEQLQDLQKTKEMHIKLKNYDKAAEICERQSRWREAVANHIHKRNTNRKYLHALSLMDAHKDYFNNQADIQRKGDIAKRAFIDARTKGHRDMMRDLCKYMTEEDRTSLLTELEEWDLVAELETNKLKGAQYFEKMGEYSKAVSVLDSIEPGCEIIEHQQALHTYLMKIGTSAALYRAYSLCDGSSPLSLGPSMRAKTILNQASAHPLSGFTQNQLLDHLKWSCQIFQAGDKLALLEAMSRFSETAGKCEWSELKEMNPSIPIPEYIGFLMDLRQQLLASPTEKSWSPNLQNVQKHYEVSGLVENSYKMTYKVTNVRFTRALAQIGVESVEGSRTAQKLNCSVETKTGKAAIMMDIYLIARVFLWKVLQHLEQDIISDTYSMTSEETLFRPYHRRVVREEGMIRVPKLMQGIHVFHCFHRFVLGSQHISKEGYSYCSKLRRCISIDSSAAKYGNPLHWYWGIVYTRWHGFSNCRSIRMPREWFKDLEDAAKKGVDTPAYPCIDIGRYLGYTAGFSHERIVVDPNISYWLLRAVVNMPYSTKHPGHPRNYLDKRILHEVLLERLNPAAAFCSMFSDAHLATAPNSAIKIDIRKQMTQRTDREKGISLQADGHLLSFALKQLWGYGGTVYLALRNLLKFTGRCVYFEQECSPIERPRLCAEAFLDLVEWQTLLMLPGFCQDIAFPKHVVDAIVGERDPRDYRGIKPLDIYTYWSGNRGWRPFEVNVKVFLSKVIQMMWYLVTEVLCFSDSRAVSLEEHMMSITWKRTLDYNPDLCGEVEEEDFQDLPHAQLCKRAYLMISCTVLTLAAAVGAQTDKSCMEYLSPLLECLKQLDVEDAVDGIGSFLTRSTWTIMDMKNAVHETSKTLGIAVCRLTQNGTSEFMLRSSRETTFTFQAVLDERMHIKEQDLPHAKSRDLFSIPKGVELAVANAHILNPPNLEAERAAMTVQNAWKDYWSHKTLMRKFRCRYKVSMLKWLKKARETIWKRHLVAEISKAQDEERLNFTDPTRRLNWVQMGLDCHPVRREFCTVCPKPTSQEPDIGHHNSDAHIRQMKHFQEYQKIQDYLANVIKAVYSFQREIKEQQAAVERGGVDADMIVELLELSRGVDPDCLECRIQAVEEEREWIELDQLHDTASDLSESLQCRKGQLMKLKDDYGGLEWAEQDSSNVPGMMYDINLCDGDMTVDNDVAKPKKKRDGNLTRSKSSRSRKSR